VPPERYISITIKNSSLVKIKLVMRTFGYKQPFHSKFMFLPETRARIGASDHWMEAASL
jgi:hypothetical protein